MAFRQLLDDPLVSTAFAALAGVSLHLTVFIRGEWEKRIPLLATLQVVGPAVVLASLAAFHGLTLSCAALKTALLTAGFHVGLFGSMAIYRLFFHSLRQFPGPVGAKLTTLWSIKASIPDFKQYLEIQRLHEELGDFVRIRPREISINNAEAAQQVYGSSSKCSKGPFYDLNYPARSLQMTRDKKFHSQRRRLWDKAFGARAMKDYEQRLMEHFREFDSQLAATKGKPFDATDLCEFLGFDIMGDLMFGRSFNMLKTSQTHFALDMFRKAKPVTGTLAPAYWTFMAFQRLPIISTLRSNWLNWCKQQLEERRQRIPTVPDLFSHLIGDSDTKASAGPTLSSLSDGDAAFDAELAIVAGSDTSSAALAAIVYLLAKHPGAQHALQQEVDGAIAAAGGFSHAALQGRPLLEGVVNEALRLYPPVASGLQRETPAEGAVIAGRFVPGKTLVSVPVWAVQRDPRNFPRPNEFLPERWSSRPELARRREAFIPFSTGPFACVGKPLAMMELRLAVATVVRKYEITLADEVESVRLFEEKPGWQDCFTTRVPPVKVCFATRR
ncbi:putative benzoate 4-monooxygenase cytochrome p450 [Neofusicoccum parvum]|uniref:Benzoate 4-monooxygenase cytochrome p450 n=1 Tax=Neofusicoccum parvum TaxID=310453 RepID=A0ACB5SJI3_9PEZI|nr:putative benzoate 4-monooxygenase cytochrome p450 [Neofusicoccum parvum]